MKIIKIIGAVLLIAALAGAVVLVRRSQETRRGAAYAEIEALFLPESKSLKIGDEVTTTFLLDTKAQKLSGVDVRIKYDQTKLKIKEVKPVISGGGVVALFRSEGEVLVKEIDEAKGTVALAGISLEEDPSKMASGAVSLVKMTFGAVAGGAAEVTLDGSYENMATGYNPGATDQSFKIAVIKKAVYTIGGGVTATVTPKPTSYACPTPPPGCKPQYVECFTEPCCPVIKCPTATPTTRPLISIAPTPTCQPRPKCLDERPACMIPEPMGGWCPSCPPIPTGCKAKFVECFAKPCCPIPVCPTTTVIRVTPTPGVLSCNQRCTATSKCAAGLMCVPIWWPGWCPPIPSPILEKVNAGRSLSSAEVGELVKACPESKNSLLKEGQRGAVSNEGVITGDLGVVMPPAVIGYCRNPKCPSDSSCSCGRPTPTPTCKPRPKCLDERPACMIPEPIGGWCPGPTPTREECPPIPSGCRRTVCATESYAPRCCPIICPTGTPMPTGIQKCLTCPAGVPGKSMGNANCDSKTDLSDFEIWRSEAFDQGGIEGKIRNDWKADFNCDQKVNLSDFEIWRVSYFK